MCRRTHHAPLRRLPSRNGHPTQAPPSSMVGRPQTSPTASPRRLPFLLRPIKGPHDPLHPSHRSSSLPRPCSAAARGGRAGAPPLAADLLRRRLSHLFKPLGEFLAPSSSFWCNPPRVWCPGGILGFLPASPAAGTAMRRRVPPRPPPLAAANRRRPLDMNPTA
jgi:hypothetical protein